MGQTRAKQFFHKEEKERIPILIHGDAAFAGQGVVAECFAMSGLPGHNTGGTEITKSVLQQEDLLYRYSKNG